MEDIRRIMEFEDRMAEVEHALPGIKARGGDAERYLRREIEILAEECRERRDRWAEVTERAERILARLEDTWQR